jgi:peptidyl-dipeptidase A
MWRTILILLAASLPSCSKSPQDLQKEVQAYLDSYATRYQELFYAANQADWASNTKIVEGDSTNAIATRAAREALAAFTGSE